jgi:hypothetical protein
MVSVHVCPAADRMDFTDRNYVFKTMPLAELFARAAGLSHALQVMGLWVQMRSVHRNVFDNQQKNIESLRITLN